MESKGAVDSMWNQIYPEATAHATYTILLQEADASLVDIAKVKVSTACLVPCKHAYVVSPTDLTSDYHNLLVCQYAS